MIKRIKKVLITRHVVLISLLYIFLIAYLAVFIFGDYRFNFSNIFGKYWIHNIFFTIALFCLFIIFLSVLIKIKYKRFKWKSFIKLYQRRLSSIFIFQFLLIFGPIVFISSTQFLVTNFYQQNGNKLHFLIFFIINALLIISLLIMLIFYKILKNKNDFISFESVSFFSSQPFLFILKKTLWVNKKIKKKIKSLINSIKIYFKKFIVNKTFAFTQKNILLTVRKGNTIPLI